MKFVLLLLFGMVSSILAIFMIVKTFIDFEYSMTTVWIVTLGCCIFIAFFAFDKIRAHFGDEAVNRFLTELRKRIG